MLNTTAIGREDGDRDTAAGLGPRQVEPNAAVPGKRKGRVVAILCTGQVIRDTYVVERFLGEGGFAEVFRVRHRFLGRQAMKVFKERTATLADIEERLSEAILLSRIGHPNIVRVFDANVLDLPGARGGYFTMEYVAGGSLDGYWRSYREKFMPLAEVVDIMKQVCLGLSVAHGEEIPIVHRDIKPQNILVGYDASGLRVRVSDFGLAKRVNPLTLLASARGTLGFKPPEAFENMDSCAADVWSLGTTMYLLLTDRMPFPELNNRDVHDGRRFVRPLRPPSAYNIAVDSGIEAIVYRCLAAKPEDRYPDARALLADLNRWEPRRTQPAKFFSGKPSEQTTKTAIGPGTPFDKQAAAATVAEALRLAHLPGQLMVAADLLEEAMNKDPTLREHYESQLKLWRHGVCM